MDYWKFRGKFDIAAAILDKSANGIIKSKLMYDVNMNTKDLAIYLEQMVKMGLLSYEKHNRTGYGSLYKTTEVGQKFIQIYHELDQMFGK